VHPADIQQIGSELAIKWDDGRESFIPLETLRRHCPCAGCQGEPDIMGHLHKGPDQPLTPRSFQLMRIVNVAATPSSPSGPTATPPACFPSTTCNAWPDREQFLNPQ